MIQHCQLGNSGLRVSRVALGCWPIAGISSLDVNSQDSLRTIEAAFDAGINFFDTAYSYGYQGDADILLARALQGRADQAVVATKVGTYYDNQRARVVDGRPETLRRHAIESMRRLGLDRLQLLYLHTPDPQVPIQESAGAIADLVQQGLVQFAGVSNVNLQQLATFHQVCPVTVVQPYFNMFQQESVREIRDFCLENRISIACYWVLMKGLLAGHMQRDHQFDPRDRRLTYAIYQGMAWQRAHDLIDQLRLLASQMERSVAQLVIAWTLQQPGISVALCGARRAEQIVETATAASFELDSETLMRIDQIVDSAALSSS